MTGRFTGKVVVEQEGEWFILRRSIEYSDDLATVKAPTGFITDFASVPRIFWNLAPPWDPEYSAASVIHDRLYETHELTRRQADAVFFRAMAVRGTPTWKRYAMWVAVRVGGCKAYRTGPARQVERVAYLRSHSV